MTEPNELLREINDDLRRERQRQWWAEHGKRVATGAVIILLVIVGMVFWQKHQRGVQEKATAELMQGALAMEQGRHDEAAAIFGKVAGDTRGDLSGLAQLHQAGALSRGQKPDAAQEIYRELYGTSGLNPATRDLAGLRYASALLDAGKDEDALKILNALVEENRPYRYSALELRALLGVKQGRSADAASDYATLAKAKLPDSMTARVRSGAGAVPAKQDNEGADAK